MADAPAVVVVLQLQIPPKTDILAKIVIADYFLKPWLLLHNDI